MRIQRYDSLELKDFRTPYDALYAKAAEAVIEESPEAPPPPVFSQADIDAARQAAHKEGFEAGKTAGIESVVNETHQRDNDTAEVVKKLSDIMMGMHTQYQGILNKQGHELTELVTLIARKVAGDALAAHPEKAVESMVRRCLPVVIYKPRVVIDVHPELLDNVQAHFTRLLRETGFNGELTIRAGMNIARHDVRVDWVSGYAERSTETLWNDVTALLDEVALRTHEEEPPADKTTL